MIFRNHLPKQHPRNKQDDDRSAVIVAMGLCMIIAECRVQLEDTSRIQLGTNVTYWQTLKQDTEAVLDDLAITFNLNSKHVNQILESEYVKCHLDRTGRS